MLENDKSKGLYNKAVSLIPGGVNSPVRAFKSVDMQPVFIKRAAGSKLYDEDYNEYIDYIGSWGPMILGHNYPAVIQEVSAAIQNGSSFGLPTGREVELAEIIIDAVPSLDKVRLTTSGTEAAMAAVRLARAYTKKNKVIKFEGCYHGHSDSMLVKAGSGSLTFNNLDSNGVTKAVADDTITVAYNDFDAVKAVFEKYPDQIACIILEPVAANMGVIEPRKGFLQNLRDITTQNNALLIFDEVITGFRISYGGAQAYYNVMPDLTILGKIIGGGFPIGAFGGKQEIMDRIAPEGDVYHAGTLSGNPVSVAAGIATLSTLRDNPAIYDELSTKTTYITGKIGQLINKYTMDAGIHRIGSLYTLFFTGAYISNLDDVLKIDTTRYASYFKSMLEQGIMLPPSQFEANFVSYVHSDEDLDKTIHAIEEAFKIL